MVSIERTQYSLKEIMDLMQWDEPTLRDAIINQGLLPSFYMRGAVWRHVVNADGERERSNATSLHELMYLVNFRNESAFDGYFNYCARTPDAVENDLEIFSVDGVGVRNHRISLDEVISKGVITSEELARFQANHDQRLSIEKPPSANLATETLGNRERDTLLVIIGVLCKEATIDYSKHAKAAGNIKDAAARMGVDIGETTIENKLKLVSDALASRMK